MFVLDVQDKGVYATRNTHPVRHINRHEVAGNIIAHYITYHDIERTNILRLHTIVYLIPN